MFDLILSDWFDCQVDVFDCGDVDFVVLLLCLVVVGVFGVVVEECFGGVGGMFVDVVEWVVVVVVYLLIVVFVFWGQCVFIEYLLQSFNQELC